MLKDIEIQILDFINKNTGIRYDLLFSKFPEDSFFTSERINTLINEVFIYYKIDEEFHNVLFITDYGKIFLQDTYFEERKRKKKFREILLIEFLRSVFAPIVVSFITTLITLYIKNFF